MTFDWKLAIVTLLAALGCADNGNELGFWRDGKGGNSGAETGGSGLGPSTGGSEAAGENAGGTSGSSSSGGTSGADTSGGTGADSGSGNGGVSGAGAGMAGSSDGGAGEATGGAAGSEGGGSGGAGSGGGGGSTPNGGGGGTTAGSGMGGAMAGSGGSAGNCAEITTLEACDVRSDCYPIFFLPDPMSCTCTAVGCCARFSRCVSGPYGICDGGGISCTIAMPYCEGDYVVAYRQGCYEGCVRTEDCAPHS